MPTGDTAGVVRSDPQQEPQSGISPQAHWNSLHDFNELNTTSPQSTSSVGWNLDVASLRWLGLLADDAANDGEFFADVFNWNDSLTFQDNGRSEDHPTSLPPPGISASVFVPPVSPPTPSVTGLAPIQKQEWQASIQLFDHEIPIFRRFVERLALWFDLFDPQKHFASFVPHLAMCNEGLMKAILALGARHMSLKPAESGPALDRTAAVQYYYETLRYLQQAMKFESYNRSLELIATALIVSMYEMIDGAGKGWERHLKGVFWIQRSRNIGAESLGLEGAGWWAWLRQDVWAAFREKRKVYSYHKPTKKYQDMDQYDLASKSVYLLAQAVNYSSEQERKEGENDFQGRVERALQLFGMLDEWRRHLSVHFKPLLLEKQVAQNSAFQPIWINPSPLGTAIQIHHFARILLLVHQPAPGGYIELFRRQEQIAEGVDTICGIAMLIKDEPSTVSSIQCLFAAGLYTQNQTKREAIIQMIDEHQARNAWPVKSLSEELRTEWAASGAK